MTIPSERYRSLVQMRARLINIAFQNGKILKKEFRRELASLLRHYPYEPEFKQMAKKCPDLLKP